MRKIQAVDRSLDGTAQHSLFFVKTFSTAMAGKAPDASTGTQSKTTENENRDGDPRGIRALRSKKSLNHKGVGLGSCSLWREDKPDLSKIQGEQPASVKKALNQT